MLLCDRAAQLGGDIVLALGRHQPIGIERRGRGIGRVAVDRDEAGESENGCREHHAVGRARILLLYREAEIEVIVARHPMVASEQQLRALVVTALNDRIVGADAFEIVFGALLAEHCRETGEKARLGGARRRHCL